MRMGMGIDMGIVAERTAGVARRGATAAGIVTTVHFIAKNVVLGGPDTV
jgi:hypothetical protein